ncbi:retrovirus-related pol polyprotein from transposon TNT 1-94 [Tanacetum coccineum]|uniref:Retrovirus-related pol polyprotein from transposon TNT 1-94 n=1 Tax=Tanacetum coccineum TaxID=301880 RepID=A0ABQ5H403_9ASTR
MDKCNPVGTPIEHKEKPSKHDGGKAVDLTLFKSLVGSLCYLTCTRPDILFAVGLISHFMEEPTTKHLKIAKRILRYIKGTVDYGMLYSTSEDFKLVRYSNSDWAGSKDDGRTEYVATTSCVCHAIWLRSMLKELHMEQDDATEKGCPSDTYKLRRPSCRYLHQAAQRARLLKTKDDACLDLVIEARAHDGEASRIMKKFLE